MKTSSNRSFLQCKCTVCVQRSRGEILISIFMQDRSNKTVLHLFQVFPVFKAKLIVWTCRLATQWTTKPKQFFLLRVSKCYWTFCSLTLNSEGLPTLPTYCVTFLYWNDNVLGVPVVCWGSENTAQTVRPWSPWFCPVSEGPEGTTELRVKKFQD